MLPAHALHAPEGIPISQETRVGDFSKAAAGRLSWRHELSPANTPVFWLCGYKTASGQGNFMSPDPLGHDANVSLYDFCSGNPVGLWDADGRFGKGAAYSGKDIVIGTGHLLWNVGGTIGYGATSIFSQNAANDIYGNQWNGLKNVGKGFGYLGNQAWQGNWSTIGKSLTGGEGRSGAFRVSYAGVGIASLFVGGELGEVGTVSRTAEVAEVGSQAARASSIVERFAQSATEITAPNGKFYSAAFQTTLKPTSYPGVLRSAHFQEANEALLTAMENDPQFAQTMQQLGINLDRTPTGLAPRMSPAGWTWHHAEDPGVMQLVPRSQHAPGSIFQDALHPNGQGGYSIWGQP